MDTVELGTPAWHDARRMTVGGSEVAALFGLSPHLTRFQLWHIKAGNLPPPDLSDNDRVFWGAILEPAIAAGVAAKKSWDVLKWTRWLKSERCAGLSASLDYVINDTARGKGALEIKTVDGLQFRAWEDGEPPMAYMLQLQAQLAVTGWDWGAIAVLIGGNDLRIFEHERHDATIRKIEAEVAAFWQSIRDSKEPAIDFNADADAIKELHRDIDGETRDFSDSNRLPVLCGEYKAAGADESAAKARKEAAHAEILSLIGKTGLATTKGWRIKSTTVAGGPVCYVREPYRRMTITETKEKH